MARILIEDYNIFWDFDDDVGKMSLKLKGRAKYKDIPLKNVGEFNAISNLMTGSKPVFVDKNKCIIGTA